MSLLFAAIALRARMPPCELKWEMSVYITAINGTIEKSKRMGVLPMSIEWLRDLVISISGLVFIGVLILLTILGYSLYRRTKAILDSVKATSKTVQGVTSYVGDEVVKPLTQVVAVAEGIRQGIATVNKLFQKRQKEEKKDE
jgi:hypothetical protein